MESTLFLYFLFHLLSEAFYYENNLSFDIVLIAKPKLRRDYIFMIHQEQLRFNKKIKFNFKGGDLTSDAGLLLIQEFMHHMKFPELLKQYFYLETDQAIRTHTNHDLCLQQIYQTIAGYHCADDADELRVDPLLTTLLDKPSLASQPTLSRFTHRLTKETSKQFELINQKLLSQFYQVETPNHFIFDVDSTHFQTYGHQYGKAFNAHYQAQGFHPLMVFDGMTGDCLKVELRAGNVYTSRNIVSFIGPLLSHYQKRFPSSYRIVRGDSGFAHKELYKLCETLNTNYVIRLKANATLYRLAKEVMDVFLEECSLQYSQQFYGEFEYQAKSWDRPRRVIVQARRKAGELIPDYLFLVTNMETRPEMVISLYAKRGTMENYIKECKNGFRMDKVSHKHWMTNVNRIQLMVLAYNLINGFRRLTLPHEFSKMQIETLRIKLIKIAAKRVKQSRRIMFKLCSHHPYKEVFHHCLKTIQAIQLE